jgi:circadian clock protein KaiC
MMPIERKSVSLSCSSVDGAIVKLRTGIDGFDLISNGGLPEGRTTLVSGTSGSAKTVFATQFLAAGITQAGEPGVFVTCEESPSDLCRNMRGFGWDIAEWEASRKWAFVDAAPRAGELPLTVGDYDLGGLLIRVENAVKKLGAKRVSLDSIGGVFAQFNNPMIVRQELLRVATAFKQMGVTAIITAERADDSDSISCYGVEEFVADNVIVLRNTRDDEKRRRTIEVLKFRGTNHQKGEWPFTILPREGIVAVPLSAIELKQRSSDRRISSGDADLDRMCGGGFFRDSIILVSGATGTGKTLITTEFIAGGIEAGERCLLFAFEESRDQLFRNAHGWGIDFANMETDGRLKVVCEYPEASTLEDHLISMKRAIEDFQPTRLAVDSLSALERVSTPKSFREFVICLTSFIKHQEVAGLFTATTPTLLGGTSTTETHISTITDSIILLRYVELHGEMRRGLTVLKLRGSKHDKDIREFVIDDQGMHLGKPFRNIHGILSGNFRLAAPGELDRLNELFTE